ncbi:MAG: hypothetical protein KGN33_08155 [Paracoccaceae bacterium]|nr:hypothetical protein [Paracoccaceae bacterium]
MSGQPDTTFIVDLTDGVERRLAYGVGPYGAEAVAVLSSESNLKLDEGDLRFLSRALAAVELPQRYPENVPPFEIEDPPEAAPTERPVQTTAKADRPPQAGKRWTDDDCAALQALYRAGQSTAAIAARLGRTETAVIGRLIATGLAQLQPILPAEDSAQ